MKRIVIGLMVVASALMLCTPAMAHGYRYGGGYRGGFYAGYRPYYGVYRPYYGPGFYPPPPAPYYYPAPVYPAPGIGVGVYTPGFSFSVGR